MTHVLKVRKHWADAKLANEKPFEVRVNDRGFQKGDVVRYRVVTKDGAPYRKDPSDVTFGGSDAHPLEECDFRITYVQEGIDGLEKGYCVFADSPVGKSPAPDVAYHGDPPWTVGYGSGGTTGSSPDAAGEHPWTWGGAAVTSKTTKDIPCSR